MLARTIKKVHLTTTTKRCFTYDMREIKAMNSALQRKINVLKMFTEYKTFNYEQPEMTYDKKTGNVTIIDPKDRVQEKKRIIKNTDEVNQMKKQLYDELGLDQDGLPKDTTDPKKVDVNELSERLKRLRENIPDNLDFDPNQFYQFSRDFMRVDIGLMIQRPPIFVHLRN